MKKFILFSMLFAASALAQSPLIPDPCAPVETTPVVPLAQVLKNFCPTGASCYTKTKWAEPQKTVQLTGQQLLVVKLPMDDPRTSGRISTAGVASNQATRILKISTTPGDVSQTGYCYNRGFEAVSLSWATGTSQRRNCLLTKGVQYYLNIQHTANCPTGTKCGFYLTY